MSTTDSYKIQLTIIRFLPLKSISYNLAFQLIIKIVYLSRALPNYKRSSKYIIQHPLNFHILGLAAQNITAKKAGINERK